MIDDFDKIRFVAKLEYDGWKKEMEVSEMGTALEFAVIKKIQSLVTIEETPPLYSDLETVRFHLDEIEAVVIEKKIKTYYLKYIRR